MGFFSKLAFWKKEEPDFLGNTGKDLPGFGQEMGNLDFKSDFGKGDFSGMPDVTAFKGSGDYGQAAEMNRSLQQMPPPAQPTGYSTFQQQAPPAGMQSGHELEVVAAKLDAIRATLDSINQRLTNIERIAYAEQEQHRQQW